MQQMVDLFRIARIPSEAEAYMSPYLFAARLSNLPYIRWFTSGELIRYRGSPLPNHVLRFIQDQRDVIVMADIVNKYVVELRFRGIHEKAMAVYHSPPIPFYGLGYMPEDFHYGMPVVLTEGILDMEAIRTIYPYVMAITTSSLSTFQVDFLATLTNRVVLCMDNDRSGEGGAKKSFWKLKERGIQSHIVKYGTNMKDPGTLWEFMMAGNEYEYKHNKLIFQSQLVHLTSL